MEALTEKRPHPVFNDQLPGQHSQSISLAAVCQEFYSSAIGKHFSTQPPRYTASEYGLSALETRRRVGIDAHPIGHQVLLARHYIDAEVANGAFGLFSEEQKTLARFVALFHEAGESTHHSHADKGLTIVGDIPHGYKQPIDRVNERRIRLDIFESHPAFIGIAPDFLRRADAIINHTPAKKDQRVHDLVEAAHARQGFDAAMTARHFAEHAVANALEPETAAHLRAMEQAVGNYYI